MRFNIQYMHREAKRKRYIYTHTQLIFWDLYAQPSLGFTENGPKKRKYPVSGNSVGKNALLMPEVRGRWQDGFEQIERQGTVHFF